MNRTELIEHVAAKSDLSKAGAARAIDAALGAIRTTLKKGGAITIVGFGRFGVGKREARIGRNPQTGAPVKIPAKKIIKFTAGRALKDAVN